MTAALGIDKEAISALASDCQKNTIPALCEGVECLRQSAQVVHYLCTMAVALY